MEARAGRLERVRRVIDRLLERRAAGSEAFAWDGSAVLREEFEERMNDNLDYAGAFDAVTRGLVRILRETGKRGLASGHRRRLEAALSDIDRVLGVLGMA